MRTRVGLKKSWTVENVLFDFDAKEPHKDVDDSDDDGEILKESQGEPPKGRLQTQKEKKEVPRVVPIPSQPLRRLRKQVL